MAAQKKQLVVFDFDWSMVDQDTDRWIFEVNNPEIRRKMRDRAPNAQWTDIVAQSLREGHERGLTQEQILETLRAIPFHPAMIRAVSELKARGETTFLCLSNANTVFIKTILESKGLQNLFDEIITNPATWEPSGLLNLRRRVDPAGPQHSCTVGCDFNMCKGEELEAFLKRRGEEYERIFYVGDGSNDFCPVLRLRSQDTIFCRRYRGLEKRINKEGGLKCQVQYWVGAWEIEEYFSKL